jgi:hypothetical protein
MESNGHSFSDPQEKARNERVNGQFMILFFKKSISNRILIAFKSSFVYFDLKNKK